MPSLRFASLLLLVAPLACGGPSSTTTEEGSSSSSGTTDTPPDTTGTSGPGVVTTTTPTTGDDTTGDSEGTTAGTGTGTTTMLDTTTGQSLCAGDAPLVLLSTSLGDMVVELDAVNAPNTVANFLTYVEDGFYDGTIFHRVVLDFVIQGGGFTPGLIEKDTNPPIALETSPKLLHVDGAISMARTNEEDSATSQFFLCDGAQPDLDEGYAAFGVVIEGFEVLDAISKVAVEKVGDYTDVPVEDVVINMAYCVAKL